MQTKRHSIIESITNTTVGFIISLLVQMVVYPVMGIKVTISENLIITVVFTIVSILRGYALRRLFNKL